MADRSREAAAVEPSELAIGSPLPPARRYLSALVAPGSYALTYLGIALTLLGFALLAIAWSKIAGLDQVWEQMPYLASAAFPGIGLVMTGLVLVNVAVKRQDIAARERQIAVLADVVAQLAEAKGRR